MNLLAKVIKSPVGQLTLVADEKYLRAVLWENDERGRVKLEFTKVRGKHTVLDEAQRQLQEYFRGTRKTFKLPIFFEGTEFQRKVWQALQKIPFGETRSYKQLAETIGSSRASRAVGAANGKNPISIIVPCHRVIGANGTLTGFAGGLNTKAQLLKLEQS